MGWVRTVAAPELCIAQQTYDKVSKVCCPAAAKTSRGDVRCNMCRGPFTIAAAMEATAVSSSAEALSSQEDNTVLRRLVQLVAVSAPDEHYSSASCVRKPPPLVGSRLTCTVSVRGLYCGMSRVRRLVGRLVAGAREDAAGEEAAAKHAATALQQAARAPAAARGRGNARAQQRHQPAVVPPGPRGPLAPQCP